MTVVNPPQSYSYLSLLKSGPDLSLWKCYYI